MSLDVYLTIDTPAQKDDPVIYVRENGRNVGLTQSEWNERFPEREAMVVPADDRSNEVYHANITHNLAPMAEAAGIYRALWRPGENNFVYAKDIVPVLESGLRLLDSDPDRFEKHNPENGWGTYEGLIVFVTEYLSACKEYPEAAVSAWR